MCCKKNQLNGLSNRAAVMALHTPHNPKRQMKTYREWQQAGFHVIRGRKASGRNERGECVFADKDVEADDYDDEDYDHPMESVLQMQYMD